MGASYVIVPWGWRHASFCWQLAHDPAARLHFLRPHPPTLWQHLRWCWDRFRHASAWILTVDGLPAGLFWIGSDRSVSVNVHPLYRRHGFGSHFIRDCTQLAHARGAVRLEATVRSGNVASLWAFTSAGYEVSSRSRHVTVFQHALA